MKIGVYNSKLYRLAKTKENKLFLMNGKKEEGFVKVPDYYDYKGELHTSLYEREIKEEELEDAYALSYKAYYKGEEFHAASVEDIWNEGNLGLDTEDIDLAEKYEFEALDRSWFDKRVKAEEIEALIEYKIPILQFENTKQMTSRKIPKEEIMDYAKYMASFA
jgi:hypothetical protein